MTNMVHQGPPSAPDQKAPDSITYYADKGANYGTTAGTVVGILASAKPLATLATWLAFEEAAAALTYLAGTTLAIGAAKILLPVAMVVAVKNIFFMSGFTVPEMIKSFSLASAGMAVMEASREAAKELTLRQAQVLTGANVLMGTLSGRAIGRLVGSYLDSRAGRNSPPPSLGGPR